MKRILLFGLFLIMLSEQAFSQGLSPTDRQGLSAAGARLQIATTAEQRLSALFDMERIVRKNLDVPGFPMLAHLLGQKAARESSLYAMSKSLGDLARGGLIADAESLVKAVQPILKTVGKLIDSGTLLPSAAEVLDSSLKNLDSILAKFGLPSVKDALSRVLPDKRAGELLGGLDRISQLSKLAAKAKDLARMDREATKKYIDSLAGVLPSGVSVPLKNPVFIMFRDSLAWNNEMFSQSSRAIDLVAKSIETGVFDEKAYREIKKRLNRLAKHGPWDRKTLEDVIKKFCKGIPVAEKWCDDIFKALDDSNALANCDAISCDCDAIRGGLAGRILVVQCKIQEQNLIEACKSGQANLGSCLYSAKGPKATR